MFRPLKGTARANTTCPVTRVHTDPTNAARVRQKQTDAKKLSRDRKTSTNPSRSSSAASRYRTRQQLKPNWKSMPACSMATVTRAANLQDGRRGGLNTVLRAPAVVPALGLVHLRSVEPRGPLKLTWCTSLPTRCASSSSSPAGAPRQKHYMERGSRVPLISAPLRWTRERPD